MAQKSLEVVLARERAVVATALAIIVLTAWGYLVWLANGMAQIPPAEASGGMAGMDMGATVEPGPRPWVPSDFAFIFAMWTIMMVGMMTPSVAPVVLLYSGVERRARQDGRPIAAAGWFFLGYFFVWIVFSLIATAAQWLLTSLALLSPMMSTSSDKLGGAVLLVAGAYQWSPLKSTCLSQCRSPLRFLTSRGGFTSSPRNAAQIGLSHGLYCLGCCWALMALLFVGGVMNVLWVAGIAALILVEKLAPRGDWLSRLAGACLVIAGIWQIIAPQ